MRLKLLWQPAHLAEDRGAAVPVHPVRPKRPVLQETMEIAFEEGVKKGSAGSENARKRGAHGSPLTRVVHKYLAA